MITYVDHIGIVSHSLEQAGDVLVEKLGLAWDIERAPMPEGNYFAPERTRIFFVRVGLARRRSRSCCPTTPRAASAATSSAAGPDCTTSATAATT